MTIGQWNGFMREILEKLGCEIVDMLTDEKGHHHIEAIMPNGMIFQFRRTSSSYTYDGVKE